MSTSNHYISLCYVAIISCGIFVSMTAQVALAASGSFRGVQGESVRGTVSVENGKVKLSSGFRSSSGPDLYVYLGNSKPTKIVARLRRLSGTQTYSLPSGLSAKNYSAVFIHCKRYNHTFGKASLR